MFAAISNVCSMISMENAPVGVKLEEFYLALSQQPPNVEWIIDSMHLMEDHQPLRQHNETAEVVSEIVKDCRKKCAQQLRAPFAEVIRNVIAACRKRLVSKAALDSESSLQHNQRHLNTLLELLGTWSNIVAQCVAFGFSRALTRQILSPLYTRILEASVECFKTFKRDKELEQWSVRSLDESAECNVGSLDFLTSQVAGIKELVHQHYSFLYNNFCDYDVDGVPEPAGVAVMESMLIVTPEELLQWRELDALYVTMEFGFVQRASQEALKEKELIEVENSVFLPQCIEDIFFVLNKVSERALSTGSESNIFSIGNRIIEAIRETPPQEYDKHSVLYRIVTSAMFYHHCIARRAVSGRALTRIINGPRRSAPSSSKLNTPMKDSFASNGNSSSGGNNSTYSTPAKGLVGSTSLAQMILGNSEDGAYYSNTLPSSPAMGLASALSDVASVSLTGVNWWLADQLSPYLKADDNSGSAAANPPTAAGPPLGMTQGSRVASSGNMGIAMQDTPSPCNNGTAGSGANNTTISSPPQSTHGRAPLPPTGGGFNTPAKPPNGNNRLVAHTSPPVSNNGRNSATTSGEYSSAPVSAPSNLSLDQLLLNALVGEEDSDNDDDQYGTSVDVSAVLQYRTLVDTAEGAFYIDRVDEMRHRLPLCEADWVVQLNTLCMVVSCIGSLKSTYQRGSGVAAIYKAPVNNGTNKSGGGPIDILLQELSTCEAQYNSILTKETQLFAKWIFISQMETQLLQFCAMKFDITGQEMEDRSAENMLLNAARKCLGITPLERYEQQQLELQGLSSLTKKGIKNKSKTATSSNNNSNKIAAPSSQGSNHEDTNDTSEVEVSNVDIEGTFMYGCDSHLSQGAYVVFLRELSSILSSQIFEKLIYRVNFSEWGALLLYQEVIALASYMENLIDHLDPIHISTVKATFVPLNLALKILTLDAPGDIRRYSINKAALSEEQVRSVLSRRLDFSKDAVAKVKVTLV